MVKLLSRLPFNSVATGMNVTAKGANSVALGASATANDDGTIAIGSYGSTPTKSYRQ